MTQKKPTNADINLALDGSLVQWRIIPVVPGISISPMLKQQLYDISMPKAASIVQWYQASIVTCQHICTTLQQVFHNISPAKPCKQAQHNLQPLFSLAAAWK